MSTDWGRRDGLAISDGLHGCDVDVTHVGDILGLSWMVNVNDIQLFLWTQKYDKPDLPHSDPISTWHNLEL